MIFSLSAAPALPLTVATFFFPAYALTVTLAFLAGPSTAVVTVNDFRSLFGVAVNAPMLVRATGSIHTDCQMPEAAV